MTVLGLWKADKGETLLENFRVAREDEKKIQRTVIAGCDKHCRGPECSRSLTGAGPSRRHKRGLDSNRSCGEVSDGVVQAKVWELALVLLKE